MKIESIRLKNFKAFKDAELKGLSNFCVIVGANGSGKRYRLCRTFIPRG